MCVLPPGGRWIFVFARGEEGAPARTIALGAVGFQPAKREITRSPAMNKLQEIMRAQGQPLLSEEQGELRNVRRDLLTKARAGDLDPLVNALLEAKDITPAQGRALIQRAQEPPIVSGFKRLQLSDASKVWDVADAAERDLLFPYFGQKLQNAALAGDMRGVERAQAQLLAETH